MTTTTIGYATLQIIPSLKGVSEAIEKQLGEAGKASGETYSEEFNKQVTKDAKPDEAIAKGTKTSEAGKAAGKEYSEEFNKQVTQDVKVDEAITKSTKTAGGGVGQAAKEAAGEFGKGFREGVQDALSQTTIDDTLVKWGGRFGEVLKPAVEAGLGQVSQGIRNWSGGIAADILSGDIQGAANSITGVIQNTTNVISTIGNTFHIETGPVESASQSMITSIGGIGTKVQNILDGAGQMGSTFRGAEAGIKTLSDASVTLGGKDFASEDTKFGKSLSKLSLIGDAYDSMVLLADLTRETVKLLPGNRYEPNPHQPGVPVPDDTRRIRGGKPRQYGGEVTGPGGTDNVLSWLTAGEGVITKSAMGRGGAEIMAALNAGWMIPGYDSGGLITPNERNRMGGGTVNLSLLAAVRSNNPNAVLTSAKTDHEVDQGYHPKGKAIDIDPSATNLDYVWSIRDQLAMIIYDHPTKVWYNVGGVKAAGQAARNIYGASTMAGHGDHIHVAADHEVEYAGSGGGQVADWDAIAMKESGGRWDLPYGDRDSTGGLQIRQGTWEDFGGLDIAAQPYLASKAEQIAVAERILAAQGPQAWAGGANFVWKAGAPPAAPPAAAPASPPVSVAPTAVIPASSRVSVPSSISGLSGFGLDQLNVKTKATPNSPERTFEFGKAAGAAVSGQVASALGVFGVPDSPGWLKGISTLVGGISVGGSSSSAAPLAATRPMGSQLGGGVGSQLSGGMHGSRAGQQPGPGVVYNIAARDTEDAFIRAQRQERERAAAKLSKF